VADDHPVFREGLLRIVAGRPSFELAGEAGDAPDALEAIESLQPDIALLDVRMPGPGPLEVLQRARRASARTRVVFLTGYEDRDLVYSALAEGAAGFLSKAADRDEILDAIEAIGRGEVVLSPPLQTQLAQEIRHRTSTGRPALTEREQEVLHLIADGNTTPQIAQQLHLGVTTVKHHLQSLYEKLEVNDRAAAVASAMRRGMLR
jgi:two-component system nitrate/nitrite response regulator NarL